MLVAQFRGRTPAGLWRLAVIPSVINALGQICFTWAHYKIDPGLLTFGLRVQVVFVAIGAYLLFPSERRIVRSWRFILGFVMVLGGTAAAALLGDSPFAAERLFGVTLAIGSGALFAAYGLSVRKYMHGLHPVIAFAAISQYTAAVMVGLMLALGDDFGAGALRLSGTQFGLLLFSAVIGIALGHVFYYTSIAKLGVAVTAGVLQLQPFAVAIASLAIFNEQLLPTQWAGGVTAVIGAMFMLDAQRRLSKLARLSRIAAATSNHVESSDAARAPAASPADVQRAESS